jgi:hypothetical protein
MTDIQSKLELVRLIARVLSVALFAFWGAFFVEHLWQWFIEPFPQSPPLSVWIGQFLHLLILVGLVIGFKWERAGGFLVIAASVLFFVDKAPLFIPITILPPVLSVYCSYRSRRTTERIQSRIGRRKYRPTN